MSNFVGPQLTDILAAIVTMIALIGVTRVWKPRDGDRFLNQATKLSVEEDEHAAVPIRNAQVLYAWLPYGLLVLCVLLWGFKPFQNRLNIFSINFQWPMLHDLVLRMPPITTAPSPYHAIYSFNWLSASGTS